MKLTDEELSDLMSVAIDYADERENARGCDKREARYALVAMVEQLMAKAYEAGKADVAADSRMYTGL